MTESSARDRERRLLSMAADLVRIAAVASFVRHRDIEDHLAEPIRRIGLALRDEALRGFAAADKDR